MGAPALVPPPEERAVGLEFYATDTPGIFGSLKAEAEDFQVREISLYPRPVPHGPVTVLRVVSRNWEQHELAARIGQRLGLRPGAIRWAGTKDRRAVAERLLSYRGPPPPSGFAIPDLELIEAYQSNDELVLGHHFGNAFDVRVRDSPLDAVLLAERCVSTTAALRAAGGFPNLFGRQRFGEVRPITHRVGAALVRGDIGRAVDLYLAEPTPGPSGPLGEEARRNYAKDHDATRALREFPPQFRFERSLLDHLARGHPPERALRSLSRDLRTLFVHAYQAYLFNRWLSARAKQGIPPDRPEPGDFLLRVTRDGTIPGTQAVPVALDNLPECRATLEAGRARIAGPLVGFETPRLEGPSGELFERMLEEEQVTRRDFELRSSPDLASRGSWRPIACPLPPIAARVEAGARFSFALPKGAYATVLLREYLKTGSDGPLAP